jgi:DNA-binding Lrp family transcriptional regulator
MLTKAEKEKRVIELFEQNKTYREIAQEVHMSPNDISNVVKRYTGEAVQLQTNVKPEQQLKQKTIDTRAFILFEAGCTLLQVSIELNLKSEDITRLYKEYCDLKGLHGLSKVYEELGKDITPFIKFYHKTKNAGLDSRRVVDALNIVEQIPYIEDQHRTLLDDINVLDSKKKRCEDELYYLNNQKALATQTLNACSISFGVQQTLIAKLENNKQQLEGFIERLKANDEEYKKVVRIAKENVMQILDNKRAMLNAVIVPALEALKEHPEKQLLIYDSLDSHTYRSSHIHFGLDSLQYRQLCLKDLQEEAYDKLSNSIVADAMSSASAIDIQLM